MVIDNKTNSNRISPAPITTQSSLKDSEHLEIPKNNQNLTEPTPFMEMEWRILDGQISIESRPGSFIAADVRDIWTAAFEAPSDAAKSVSAAGVMERCNFSRYPLQPVLFVGPDSGKIRCSFKLSDGKLNFDLNPSMKDPSHIIVNETWYPIQRGGFDALHELMNGAGIEQTGIINLRQYLFLKKAASDCDDIVIDESIDGIVSDDFEREEDCGGDFTGNLYPYQQNGFNWLSTLFREGVGGILADEMGLGKTIQIISLLSSYDKHRTMPALVVAPTTLLENWRREILKFTNNVLPVKHRGPRRTGLKSELESADVTITSYDTLCRDIAMFGQVDWKIVILDEAQAIKNASTKRSQAVKRLGAGMKIAVTGTPVENSLSDIWSIFDFSLPGFLGTKAEFDKNYLNDEVSASELEPVISPIILRRKISDVAKDLPERIDVPIVIDLDEDEAAKYEIIRQQTLAKHPKGGALACLTKLRQFCAHPSLCGVGSDKPEDVSLKYRLTLEILEEIFSKGEKVLVFTSYNGMAELLARDIPPRFDCYRNIINGSTPVGDRQGIVDEFNDSKSHGFLALNPRAAGTGLNITGANHVIHLNPEWNPAVEDQATARAHRRGQTLPVTVHKFYYANTVEEVMMDRLNRKRGVANTAIVGTDGADSDSMDIMRAINASPLAK